MQLAFITHPVQLQVLMTHYSILIEYLVELAQFETDHFVEMLTLEMPVLLHNGGELLEFILRDEECGLVVILIEF